MTGWRKIRSAEEHRVIEAANFIKDYCTGQECNAAGSCEGCIFEDGDTGTCKLQIRIPEEWEV